MEDKLDTQESFMDKTDSSLRFNRKNSLGIEEESKDSHRRVRTISYLSSI